MCYAQSPAEESGKNCKLSQWAWEVSTWQKCRVTSLFLPNFSTHIVKLRMPPKENYPKTVSVTARSQTDDNISTNSCLLSERSAAWPEFTGSIAASVGVLPSIPNKRKDGFSPVDLWGRFQYARNTPWRNWSLVVQTWPHVNALPCLHTAGDKQLYSASCHSVVNVHQAWGDWLLVWLQWLRRGRLPLWVYIKVNFWSCIGYTIDHFVRISWNIRTSLLP